MGMEDMPATEQFLLARTAPFQSSVPLKPLSQDAMDFQSVIILIAVFVAFGWVAYASTQGNRESRHKKSKSFWQRFYRRPPRKQTGQKAHWPGRSGKNDRI